VRTLDLKKKDLYNSSKGGEEEKRGKGDLKVSRSTHEEKGKGNNASYESRKKERGRKVCCFCLPVGKKKRRGEKRDPYLVQEENSRPFSLALEERKREVAVLGKTEKKKGTACPLSRNSRIGEGKRGERCQGRGD